MSTMDFLYDQEYVTKVHEEALARDSFNKGIEVGEKQGIQQGIQQGMKQGVQQENTELLKKLVAAGLLTHKQAKIYTK